MKSKIEDLKDTIDYCKNKFNKLKSFLHDKPHSWYDKDDKYIDVVNDIDDNDINKLDLSKKKWFRKII